MLQPNELDKHKILDTINQWIFNCDTKASIIIGFLSVFFTIIFSSNVGDFLLETIKISISSITVCSILFLCILVLGTGLLLFGIYKLVRVLIPIIDLSNKSIMFFGKVASYPTFDNYFDVIKSYDTNEVDLDLLHQIYTASKICNQKFKNQTVGIKYSFLGIAVLVFWAVLGLIVYYF